MLRRSILFLTFAFGLATATPAAAQAPHVQTAEEALAQDAGEYAQRIGVDAGEAARRLRAQALSVAFTRELEEAYRARLAGISFQHRPDFRIIVLLTGDVPVADRAIRFGEMVVPVEFRIGARATRAGIETALRRYQPEIARMLPGAQGMGYDARRGELVVMLDQSELDGRDEADVEARLEALTGVPVRLRVLGRTAAREASLESSSEGGVEGGVRVEGSNPGDSRRFFCTTGFIVTDGARTGVVTAAHCPDSLTYQGPDGAAVPLDFVGQWGAQFQDVQVNVGKVGARPLFYSDRGRGQARALTGARQRSSVRAGETVCHRGESSGYSCSEVDLLDYAPPGDLCGGPCHPVWTSVTGPGCRNGDSGGPVFSGTIALGLLKGGNYNSDGRCNFYYFMSTDYLPPGWSLLTEGEIPPPAPNAPAPIAARTNSPGRASP
jgi:hypothetical protein